MSEFIDRMDKWQREQNPSEKPPKPDPQPGRPLTQRLETMANMFTYDFWGWEYSEETRTLLLEAAIAIETYEELTLMSEEKEDE